MVEVVRISKEGFLLEIKEVSDKYRDEPYIWDDSSSRMKKPSNKNQD